MTWLLSGKKIGGFFSFQFLSFAIMKNSKNNIKGGKSDLEAIKAFVYRSGYVVFLKRIYGLFSMASIFAKDQHWNFLWTCKKIIRTFFFEDLLDILWIFRNEYKRILMDIPKRIFEFFYTVFPSINKFILKSKEKPMKGGRIGKEGSLGKNEKMIRYEVKGRDLLMLITRWCGRVV